MTHGSKEAKRERQRLNSSRKRSAVLRMYMKQQGRCARCHCHMHRADPDDWNYATIDHIIPLSRGGKDHAGNRQLLCRWCNQFKGSELPAETETRKG